MLPNGRMVRPTGRRSDLGDFPGALAVSPDGRLAVAVNVGRANGVGGGDGSACDDIGAAAQCGYVPKRYAGDPDVKVRDESLSVVDLQSGKVATVHANPSSWTKDRQEINYFSPGVAFSPDGKHLYATGGGNNAVYDFAVEGGALSARPKVLVLPSSVSSSQPNGPVEKILGDMDGYTRGLAVTPDGKSLLVVKEYDNDVTVVDTASMTATQHLQVDTATRAWGSYLNSLAVTPDGRRAFLTAQGTGKLYALDRADDGTWSVGPSAVVGDHPTAVTVRPDGGEVAVSNANDDTVAVVDPASLVVRQHVPLKPVADATWGSIPNGLAYTADGARLYVAAAGMDAVAVLDRTGDALKVSGFVPTGWYPTAVAVAPKSGDLLAVSAKGVGIRYLPQDAPPKKGGPQALDNTFRALEDTMPGLLTRVRRPGAAELATGSTTVKDNISYVTKDLERSPHNPVPLEPGGPTPITHVVYVVRENRTFDQVFGDLGATRKDVDADPQFELLSAATPNAHAVLEQGGATGDRFFSDGEASIQGHWWTSGAAVSDYTEKGWHANYSGRGKPYDFVLPVAQTKGCTVFQAAQRRADDSGGSWTFRNYGEPLGYLILDVNTERAVDPCPAAKGANQFTPLLNNIDDLSVDDRTRVAKVLDDMGLDENGQQVGDPSTKFLRNFSYVTLPQDHTLGFNGSVTPRAAIAQNDEALGTLLHAISSSKYWSSTAVVVVEDDSADGLDHVDGHRNILLVASPYARHKGEAGDPGYVSHQHLDQSSVVRTIGLLMGWPPLATNDQFALPLYDLFQDVDDPAKLTEADLRPFTPAAAPSFIEEPISAYKKENAAALHHDSTGLNVRGVDRAGPMLESVLWRSLRDEPVPAELTAEMHRAGQSTSDDDGE